MNIFVKLTELTEMTTTSAVPTLGGSLSDVVTINITISGIIIESPNVDNVDNHNGSDTHTTTHIIRIVILFLIFIRKGTENKEDNESTHEVKLKEAEQEIVKERTIVCNVIVCLIWLFFGDCFIVFFARNYVNF